MKSFSKLPLQSKLMRINKLLYDTPDLIKKQFQWDDEALWSFTPFEISNELCQTLLSLKEISAESTITDATASVGGNTIPFARHFKSVNAIEINSSRNSMLKHNLKLFKINNVNVIHGQYQDYLNLKQDIIYLDLPWGIDYKKYPIGEMRLVLSGTENISLEELMCRVHNHAIYCLIKIPVNYDVKYLLEYTNEKWNLVWSKKYPKPNTHMIFIFKAIMDI